MPFILQMFERKAQRREEREGEEKGRERDILRVTNNCLEGYVRLWIIQVPEPRIEFVRKFNCGVSMVVSSSILHTYFLFGLRGYNERLKELNGVSI